MNEEQYDELTFKMANGDTFTKRVRTGAARTIFEDVSDGGWIDVDDTTRIRKSHIVSIRLKRGRMNEWRSERARYLSRVRF